MAQDAQFVIRAGVMRFSIRQFTRYVTGKNSYGGCMLDIFISSGVKLTDTVGRVETAKEMR